MCVCVCIIAVVTRHANRIFYAPYYVICGLPRSTTYFHLISQTAGFSGGGGYWTQNVCFDFSTFSDRTFLILRRIQRDIIIHVHMFSRKVSVFVRFISNLNFIGRYSKNPKVRNFAKIRPVGAEMFHADGQTFMTKLILAFRNFANASNKSLVGHGVQPEVSWQCL
jgi:hypothetical protein